MRECPPLTLPRIHSPTFEALEHSHDAITTAMPRLIRMRRPHSSSADVEAAIPTEVPPESSPAEVAETKSPGKSFRHRIFPGFPDTPPFRQFLKHNWLDITTQLLCTLGAFLIYRFAQPLMPRQFPLFPGIDRTEFGTKHGKPYQKEYITTTVSAAVSFGLPAIVMGALGLWRVRSFEDTHAAIMGLGYALSTATLFQSVIKWTIGGLRPHFLDVCAPSPPDIVQSPAENWKTVDVCTGAEKKIREAQLTFPSGHSVAAFAGFGFLFLYMTTKFSSTTQDSRRVPHWRFISVFPLLLAVIIAGSKIRDGWHHPEDVISGSLIGGMFAYISFRMVY